MTKINETNLLDMTEQENLTVEDIFNENMITKIKKAHYTAIDEAKTTNKTPNNIKVIDQTFLKRKTKPLESNTNYDTEKLVQPNINITIDKYSDQTIRLELRHPDNQCVITDYKINDEENGEVLALGNDCRNGYSMKHTSSLDSEEGTNEDVNVQNEDFVNGNEGDNKVRI
ncbi:jg11066 [Pararge aegeria aegeria]|uniref:Jg11066 protein n=1 Tax=Pararge aegeria aegeria TaxID=348720 RepID=A0A8S4R637_9NEOP|nr:jg11066 [Pararge aegeria aegeria]